MSSDPTCPVNVSFVGYVSPPVASPCDRLSRPLSTINWSDSQLAFGSPPFWAVSPTTLIELRQAPPVRVGLYVECRCFHRPDVLGRFPCFLLLAPFFHVEQTGPPKFLAASLHAYHALFRPRQTLRVLTFGGLFVLASDSLTSSPSAFLTVTRLYQASGSAVSPAVYVIPCVRFICYVRLRLTPPRRCNTRYEWLVRPFSAGTPTLQEAPSFSWRTSDIFVEARPLLLFLGSRGVTYV